MHDKNYITIAIILLLLSLFWHGCTYFKLRPSSIPVLEKVSSRYVNSHGWSDDMNYEGLQNAIEQSTRYFDRISSDASFTYDGLTYTAEEMKRSMKLFLDIIENSTEEERMRNIREKFLFFESKQSDGDAFFTGYYEPIIDGSLTPTEMFTEPILMTPDDLIEVRLGDFSDKWKRETILGRLEGKRLIPYDRREEIVYGDSLQGRAKPIAYVDEIELFFLQIQGSGLVALPDGKYLRVNYAQKNGHPYRSIGEIIRGKIAPVPVTLQSIKSYLRNNPDEVRDTLTYNQSYTFFRITEEGPLGYMNVPLTPHRSIAMDRNSIPKGGLAYIETELPIFDGDLLTGWYPVRRFVLVQDTGAAIREHGRVDLFVGSGLGAELIAGHLKNRGRVFLLVAKKEFLKDELYIGDYDREFEESTIRSLIKP